MNTIDHALAARALRSLVWPLRQYSDQVDELLTDYPDLRPELEVANEHVAEAVEAVQRAMAFVRASFDAERE